MFYLKSFVDGFSVIISPWIVQIAQFLSLIIMIRPPEYEGIKKTQTAKTIYAVLLVSHFFAAVHRRFMSHLLNVISSIHTVFMLSYVVTSSCMVDK